MAKKPSPAKAATPLRRKAEKLWTGKHTRRRSAAATPAAATPAERFELEVHQIELELQNEELRRAQAELIEARDNYLELYDFAPVGYLMLDAGRVIRKANLTAAKLLGVDRGKLLGMRIERFAMKEARDALYLHLQEVRESQGSRTCAIPLRRGDGATIFARLESAPALPPLASGDGFYRVALIDNTSLQLAEQGMQKSECRFRALTERSADSISIVDKAGKILYENPSAETALGFRGGELVGRSGFEFIHPDDLPAAEKFFRDVARHRGRSREVELRATARDGTLRWLRIVATNLLDDPAVAGIVLNSHDVTARRESADELRRMNQALDRLVRERTAAIQMLHDITSMANRAHDLREAIDYCLHRLTAFDGWCCGHALRPAKDNADVFVCELQCYPNDAARFLPFGAATGKMAFDRDTGLIGQVFAQRKPVWSIRLVRELAEPRAAVAAEMGLMTAVAFPVIVADKIVAVLEFFADKAVPPDDRFVDIMVSVGIQLGRVVERMNFEERLLSVADEMQQAIAQDLHDDVGQELTGLGLKAETLFEAVGQEKPQVAALAASVLRAVEAARKKAQNLSRRVIPVELESGSLPGALAELAAAASAGARAACTFQNEHPDVTFAGSVATHLYRIAQESVSNALRHSAAKHVRIKLACDGDQTVLTIADDGHGIDPAIAHSDGLGLRIMRYRAGLIGATLDIETARPRGTVVRCRLATKGENAAFQPIGKVLRGPCITR